MSDSLAAAAETVEATDTEDNGAVNVQEAAHSTHLDDQEAPSAEAPDWLGDDAEKYYSGGELKAQQIYEDLQNKTKQALDFRRIISKGRELAPDDVSEYVASFEDEGVSAYMESLGDDKLVGEVKDFMKAHDLPVSMYQDFMQRFAPMFAEAADPQAQERLLAENEAQIELERTEEIKKLGPQGQAIINTTFSWIDNLAHRGLTVEEVTAIKNGDAHSADYVNGFMKIRALTGERGPLAAVDNVGEGWSKERWLKEQSPDKMSDPEHRKEVMRQGELLHRQGLI